MKPRKADQTIVIVVLVTLMTIMVVTYALAETQGKYNKVSKGLKIGQRQFQLFSTYAEGEKALAFVDFAAGKSMDKTYNKLAQKGGLAEAACGEYDGLALWKNGENNCYPDTGSQKEQFYKELKISLEEYYKAYPKEIPADYKFAIKDEKLFGISAKNIEFKKEGTDSYVYKIRPSFSLAFAYDFSAYDALSKKAKEIESKCSSLADLKECAREIKSDEEISYDVGCGEKPNEMQRMIKVCAKKDGVDYRFALNIPFRTEFGNCMKKEYIGEFKITSYFTPLETEYLSYDGFFDAVKVQGSGIRKDGKLLRYDGSVVEAGANTRGITMTGTNPTAKRTIAVDPDAIPLNSLVFIDFGNGNEFSKVYKAEDTGGGIKGNKIDVYMGTGKESLKPLPDNAFVYKAVCE